MSQTKISVRILNRDYQFACQEDERTSLLSAADHLDNTMREIKDNNSTMANDKIVLMAAMNIAHDLIKAQNLNQQYDTEVLSSVKKLNAKLEQALTND